MPAPGEPLPPAASLSCFSSAANQEAKQSIPQPTMKVITFSGECQPLAELRPRSEHRDTGFMALLLVYGTRPFPPKFPQHRKTKAPRPGRGADKASLQKPRYSNFSVITGNCSLALARDLMTIPSALSAVVFLAVAISLTSRYF